MGTNTQLYVHIQMKYKGGQTIKILFSVNMSVGREGGKADGRIVYVVVYYINDSGQTFGVYQH